MSREQSKRTILVAGIGAIIEMGLKNGDDGESRDWQSAFGFCDIKGIEPNYKGHENK